MTLKQALVEYLEADRVATSDPMDYPKATRAGHQAKITQTKNEMPKFVKNYVDELEKYVTKLYFTGNTEKNQNFVTFLKDKATVFNAFDIYGEIASRVKPTLSSDGTFTSESWRRYLEVTGEYAVKYSLVAKELPIEPAGVPCRDFLELRRLIKSVTEKAFSNDLNKMYVYENVFKEAISNKVKEEKLLFLPIFVDNLDERDIINSSMFKYKPSYTITFSEDENPTEDSVETFIKQTKSKK